MIFIKRQFKWFMFMYIYFLIKNMFMYIIYVKIYISYIVMLLFNSIWDFLSMDQDENFVLLGYEDMKII